MGFDFDCVLCLLLMFHPFYTSSQLDALTLALEIWTICYYVTFDLHSTMVSPAKRCVIGLRTMSFKKVSLSVFIHCPSLSFLCSKASPSDRFDWVRCKGSKERPNIVLDYIQSVSVEFFLLAQFCSSLLFAVHIATQTEIFNVNYISNWMVNHTSNLVWCNNFSIWRFVLPIYLLYIWDWLFKLKLMKTHWPCKNSLRRQVLLWGAVGVGRRITESLFRYQRS